MTFENLSIQVGATFGQGVAKWENQWEKYLMIMVNAFSAIVKIGVQARREVNEA